MNKNIEQRATGDNVVKNTLNYLNKTIAFLLLLC